MKTWGKSESVEENVREKFNLIGIIRKRMKALLRLPELLNDAEYIDAVPDPKGRDYIMASHLFKTIIADSDSWIIINESIWGEYLVHSISDNIPYVNKEQDL